MVTASTASSPKILHSQALRKEYLLPFVFMNEHMQGHNL